MTLVKETKKATFFSSRWTKMTDGYCNESSPCQICGTIENSIEGDFEVTRYPRKLKSKPAKEHRYLACILSRMNISTSCKEFLLCRVANDEPNRSLRDEIANRTINKKKFMPTGLAHLWQFPQDSLDTKHSDDDDLQEVSSSSAINRFLQNHFGISHLENLCLKYLGEFSHRLSHIHQIFDVWHLDCGHQEVTLVTKEFSHRWITEQDMKAADQTIAISTGSLKMFLLLESSYKSKKRKANNSDPIVINS
jgi:hypothetical protein